MANREEKRNLETIPVGSLGIISQPYGGRVRTIVDKQQTVNPQG